MTLLRTAPTPVAALGLLLLAGTTLAGCSPAPEPTPTPTAAFASEEEAFAAAEETYRAYLEASAARADGDESAEPERFLSGTALESDIQAQRDLESNGLRIVGASSIHEFEGLEADFHGEVAKITTEICIDISGSRVLDASGADVTPDSRPERGKLRVVFSGRSAEVRISESGPAESSTC